MNFPLKFVYFTLFYYTFICVQKSLGDSVESALNSIIESTHLLHENSTKNESDEVLSNDLVNDPNIPNSEENFIENDLKSSEILPEQINEAVISQIPTIEPVVESVTEIINNDTPIVIVSGTDPALDELEKRATIPINDNLIQSSNFQDDNISNETESLIKTDFIEAINSTTVEEEEEEEEKEEPKLPSFVEWTQKRLEEVEKKEHNNNINNNLTVGGGNNSTTSSRPKMRWKNYAGVECGAKVILTNPEAQNTWAILDVHRDEYMLNPCTSRIWFVVELCEGIQLKKLELANFELFSSSPKQFLVSVSDRFPSRDWSTIGQFTASDEKDVQHFEIETETFGKYVKIEIKSHYGEEHYCPLSLFRVFGASVFEVIQKEDPDGQHQEEDDDDNADESLNNNLKKENPNTGGNLLSSATDAVLSMVKKAAEALGKKVNKTTISSQEEEEEILNNCTLLMMKKPYCISLSYNIQCNNCPTKLFGKIYDLLSCKFTAIDHLVNVPVIRSELENSEVCEEFGVDFNNPATYSSSKLIIQQFFPQYILGAMCNLLAANNGQASYNNSFEFPNITQNRNTNYNDNNQAETNNNYKPFNNSLNHELKMMEQNNNDMINLENNDKNSKKSGCLTDTTNLFVPTLNKPIKNLELPIVADNAAIIKNDLDNEENNAEIEEPVLLDQSTEIPEEENLVAEYPNTGKDSSTANNNINNNNNSPIQGNVIQKGQRESVFLRLSNRIRVLELNMSLSGQYLEELSKRYTKQVEELQRALEKTVKTLQEVTNTKDERYQELETQLVDLKSVLDDLISEKNYWKTFALCFFLVTLSIIIAYYKLYKKYSTNNDADDGRSASSATAAAASTINNKLQRHNSVDGIIRINRIIAKKKKKRRPSDQALRIVGLANTQVKKRRKKSGNSDEDLNWIEDKISRVIQQDVPYPLEENDSYAANDRMPLIIPPSVYMRTATDFRTSVRNNNNNNVQVDDPNKKNKIIRQNSPTSSSDDSAGKNKEKKSFKKLLKRVF